MKENWTIEIKPKKRLLDIDLKGIWRYRDLYRMYVKRDIVTVYKQTILGPLWFLITATSPNWSLSAYNSSCMLPQ